MGYHMAGFDVVGVDINDQPNYPFDFIQADVLDVLKNDDLSEFDMIHASPPCQAYTTLASRNTPKWGRMIGQVRDLLVKHDIPYAIENVQNAKHAMRSPIVLCGSSFGLRVRRHRLFESDWGLRGLSCDHAWQDSHRPYKIVMTKERTNGLGYRESGIQLVHGGGHNVGGRSLFYKSVAMGIDWMENEEINEAIPPLYTKYIGQEFLKWSSES